MSARVEPGTAERPAATVAPPPADPADGASLVEVAGNRLQAGLARWRGSAAGRGAAGWLAQPLVATRGHVLLAACLIGAMLAQVGLRTPPAAPARCPAGRSPDPAHPELVEGCVPAPGSTLRQAQGERVMRSDQIPEIGAVAPPVALPTPGTIGDPPEVAGIVGRLPGNAVVLVRGENGTHALAVGGTYGEWQLIELSPTEAVFARGGARRTVELPANE